MCGPYRRVQSLLVSKHNVGLQHFRLGSVVYVGLSFFSVLII